MVAPLGPGQEIAGGPRRRSAPISCTSATTSPVRTWPCCSRPTGATASRWPSRCRSCSPDRRPATGQGIVVEHHPDRERLAELYAGAVALVHPSLYEGFGLTALEAMSAGRPGRRRHARRASRRCAATPPATPTPATPPRSRRRSPRSRSSPELRRELAERGRRRAERVLVGALRTGARDGLLSCAGPRMKIAILGTRGIPASYSGFETAVEQLASRLSARGHEVVVYCRPHVVDRKLTQLQGRGARPSADDPEQVPRHVRPHVPLGDPRRAGHAGPTRRCSSSPGTLRSA